MASSSPTKPGNAPPLHGEPVQATDQILETGANTLQNFAPISRIHAHLSAFHTPYHSPGTLAVETSHYCAHLSHSFRQCVLYDSPLPNARLIGVEYMVTPEVFATLPAEEKPLWHTHVFEVKSGMLVMPQGMADSGVPGVKEAWEVAETREMGEVVRLYGKVWQTWDTTLPGGEHVPLGESRLMTSFTERAQIGEGGFERLVGARDDKLGTDWKRKKELRVGIETPDLDPEADGAWRRRKSL